MLDSDLESELFLLSFVPRLVLAFFTIIIAILVYKLSCILYNNKSFAIVSLTIFALIPAMWPFRNFLLDPIMVIFVLLSLFVLVRKPFYGKTVRNTGNMQVANTTYNILVLILSGSLFGIALLVKLSAIFFLPIVLLFATGHSLNWVYHLRTGSNKNYEFENNIAKVKTSQRIIHGSVWLMPIIAAVLSWIVFLAQSGSFEYFVSTQLWQLSRVSSSPFESLFLLFVTSPVGLVIGLVGLGKIIHDKNQRIWSLLAIPYFGFLFRGGYVSFVHAIPLLPILSIFTGKIGYLLASKFLQILIPKSKQNEKTLHKLKVCFLLAILVVSGGITIWISSFDDTKTSRETIRYIVNEIPENAVLVTDAGYSWMIKEFRSDIKLLDFYSLNVLDKTPDEFYIAEKPNLLKFDQSLKQTQYLYDKSCLITTFQNNPSNLGFYHPYSSISERWWDVEVRYFNIKGCE